MLKNQILIKAIFKGQDGSLGYQNDKEYTLLVTGLPAGMPNIVEIERSPEFVGRARAGVCQYRSMLTFMENWDCIRNVISEKRAM